MLVPVSVIFGFVLFGLVAATWIHAARVKRALTTAVVFRQLALIVRQNIPMAMGLEFAAWGESPPVRRILARTGRLVQAGLSLSEALRRAHPGCPGLLTSIVRTAERVGTLPAALIEVNARDLHRRQWATDDDPRRWGYLVVTPVVFLLVVYGVNYYVVPRFSAIAWADGIALPTITSEIVAASPFSSASPQTALGWVYRGMLTALMLMPFALIAWGVARLVPRRADRLGYLHLAADAVRWYLLPCRWLVLPQDCAATAPAIRLAVGAGWSLPDAIVHASELDTNWFWRQRLRDWAAAIRQGNAAVDSGQTCGMPEALLRCVAIGVRDGDLDAPLMHAERYYAALAQRRRSWVAQTLFPVATLVLAAIIGVYCVGLVSGIKALIDHACAQLG